jgi:hypothetical protein
VLTLYLCFLAGGIVFPLISFLFGFLGNDVDADVDTGIDVDTDIDMDMDLDMDLDADVSADFDADADIDAPVHLDTASDAEAPILSLGLLPTSFWSLSALAVAFGAVGAVMTLTDRGTIITFIVSAVVGYFSSVIVQSIIRTLKKAQTRSSGINENELLLYDGKIIDTVLPGQLGTVSFVTLTNVLVSYPARCLDPEMKLETGRIVKVIEYKNGIFIVEPKNKYEK